MGRGIPTVTEMQPLCETMHLPEGQETIWYQVEWPNSTSASVYFTPAQNGKAARFWTDEGLTWLDEATQSWGQHAVDEDGEPVAPDALFAEIKRDAIYWLREHVASLGLWP